MWQATRRQLIVTYAISLGLATACMSLPLPIPSASAQQLIGTVNQGTSGTGTQKKDSITLTNKPHRLIRKPQNAPVASVAPSPSGTSPVSSVPTPPASLQSDNTTSQSTEPSSLNRSVGAALPLATMSVAPSSTTTTKSIAVGTTSTGTIPIAAAGAGSTSTSGIVFSGGRSMSRLAAEMPGLAQLISPPSAPVAPVNPAIGASPPSIAFTATQGGTNPANQTLNISNTGGGTLTWSASEPAPWLTLSTTGSTGNGTVTLTAATAGLPVGPQNTTITLSAPGATTVTVPVAFTITAAPVPPAIGASPATVAFTAQQGGSNPPAQTLSISNTGGGTLTWTASEPAPWLTLSTTGSTGNGTVTLTAATAGLPVGPQNTTITLSAPGATTVTVPVAFTITAAPVLGASPTALSFTATQGGANPAPKTVTISNTGGTLSWTASEPATWLTLSPATGSGAGTLAASVNTAGLAAATYNSTITVAAAGATSQSVGVTLLVNPPATSSATLIWNTNTDPDLAGYKVYRATASGAYGAPIATLQGNVTSYAAVGLQVGTTYFFAVTAYDTAGNESLHSNEVSKSIF